MKNTLANLKNVDAGLILYKFLNGKLKQGQGAPDLNLLQEQKMTLIGIIDEEREAINEEPSLVESRTARVADLEGLLGFLDAFQDMLVDELKVWEYPKEEE